RPPTAPTLSLFFLFFFTHTPPPSSYTLSLHDALPISHLAQRPQGRGRARRGRADLAALDLKPCRHGLAGARLLYRLPARRHPVQIGRAHAELQSLAYLVCRLLLEKKKK